jgi:hypothetical protein
MFVSVTSLMWVLPLLHISATSLDWASARSKDEKEWGASVTCISSAALCNSLFTGTTCTINYRHDFRFRTSSKLCQPSFKDQKNIASHLSYITLFGLLKEFSSITLLDVITVAVEPKALTLAWSPLVEIVRFTASDPKLTTCTRAFRGQTSL